MFPFAQPNLYESKRQQWLELVKVNKNHAFMKLSRKICGDQSVVIKLEAYVAAHRDFFQLE
jgi:hypothetical protein